MRPHTLNTALEADLSERLGYWAKRADEAEAERDCALSLMTESQLEEWQTMMAARTSGGAS